MKYLRLNKAVAAIALASAAGVASAAAPTVTVVPQQWHLPNYPFGPITGSRISVNYISSDGNVISGTFRTATPGGSADDRPYIYNLATGGSLVQVLEDNTWFSAASPNGMSADGSTVVGVGNPGKGINGASDAEVWDTTTTTPSSDNYNFGYVLPTTYSVSTGTNAVPAAATNGHTEVVGTQLASNLTTTVPTLWQFNGSGFNSPLTIANSSGGTVTGTPYAVSADGSTVYLQNGSTYTQWTANGSATPSNGIITGTVSPSTNINASPLFSIAYMNFTTPVLGKVGITDYLYDQGLAPYLNNNQIQILGLTAFQLINNNTQVVLGATANVGTGDNENQAVVIKMDLPTAATVPNWNVDANGQWGTNSNWTATSPNSEGTYATLGSVITAPRTVTLEANKTVSDLYFNSMQSYTLNGPGTLTLHSGLSPSITDFNGSHTINTGITVQTDLSESSTQGNVQFTVNVANAQDTLTLNGPSLTFSTVNTDTNSGSNIPLLKTGDGTLIISDTTSLVGIGELQVYGGTLRLGSFTGAGTVNPVKIFVGQGTTADTLSAASLHSDIISIDQGSLVQIRPQGSVRNSAATVSIFGQINDFGGTLDLSNNDLVDHQGAAFTNPVSQLGNITNLLKIGYNNGQWNGSGGITSSSAASDTTHLTALGVMQNVNANGSALYTDFDGQTVTNKDTLVKYTYYGDANLDGKVDGSDYSLIDYGYLSHASGWSNGDFNYDGVINGSDYTLIDNAFNTQGAAINSLVASPNASITADLATTVSAATSVPEPASAIAVALGGFLLARRRFHKCSQ